MYWISDQPSNFQRRQLAILGYYSLIASANQLMKYVITRDRLAAQRHVFCFDRETAGLMNHFPCIVIRGLCGYADTHSNDVWQGYAAMTAPAYAKDLLLRVFVESVQARNPVPLGLYSTCCIKMHELVTNLPCFFL